ncbi:MAG TPA: PA2779 family protein [Burkholderiales bacterium]|nr:PA2779 family protein [Burkholderiales bacterium]
MKRLLGILIVACALAAPAAQAAMVGTDQVVQAERERVRAALERSDVVQALKKVGVDAAAAAARVDAMSDAEVAQLSNLVDLLPAGGAPLTNDQLIIILLIVLILVIAL